MRNSRLHFITNVEIATGRSGDARHSLVVAFKSRELRLGHEIRATQTQWATPSLVIDRYRVYTASDFLLDETRRLQLSMFTKQVFTCPR